MRHIWCLKLKNRQKREKLKMEVKIKGNFLITLKSWNTKPKRKKYTFLLCEIAFHHTKPQNDNKMIMMFFSPLSNFLSTILRFLRPVWKDLVSSFIKEAALLCESTFSCHSILKVTSNDNFNTFKLLLFTSAFKLLTIHDQVETDLFLQALKCRKFIWNWNCSEKSIAKKFRYLKVVDEFVAHVKSFIKFQKVIKI